MKIIVNESQYHLIRRLDLIERLLYGLLFDTDTLKNKLSTTQISFNDFREQIGILLAFDIIKIIVGTDTYYELQIEERYKLKNELKSFILDNFDEMFKEAYINYIKKTKSWD